MSKLIELFVHLTTEEREILMFEFKDELALKFFLSRMIEKEIKKKCEQITQDEKWVMRNSTIETDETSENEAS